MGGKCCSVLHPVSKHIYFGVRPTGFSWIFKNWYGIVAIHLFYNIFSICVFMVLLCIMPCSVPLQQSSWGQTLSGAQQIWCLFFPLKNWAFWSLNQLNLGVLCFVVVVVIVCFQVSGIKMSLVFWLVFCKTTYKFGKDTFLPLHRK